MELYIFDSKFNQMGMINSYISLQWSESYNNKGSFSLICSDTAQNIKLLQIGYYIYQNNKQTAMIIKYLEYDSETLTITAHGYTTLELIGRRIVYPMQTITNIEKGMYSLVERFLKGSETSRNIDNFTTYRLLNGYKGFVSEHDGQYTGDYVNEVLTELAEESELGFYMQFDWRNKRHVFTVYEGKDLTFGNGVNTPQLFTEGFGNLQNAIIFDDMTEFRNVAYVAGEGEGTKRTVVIVGSAAGMNRYELFVDARDLQSEYTDEDGTEITLTSAQYKKVLTARGKEKLGNYLRARSFQGEVSTTGFRDKFYLGDKITAKSDRYGVRMDTRIMQYKEITEKNNTKLVLTLGTPEVQIL